MNRTRTARTIAGFAAALVLSATALAAVTIDAATGKGFVGKGDVNTALNLNNATTDPAPAFTMQLDYQLQQTCEKTVETRRETRVMTQNRSLSRSVSSTVETDTRKNRNGTITGYNLTGYASTQTLPAGICPDDESGWSPTTDLQVDLLGWTLLVEGSQGSQGVQQLASSY